MGGPGIRASADEQVPLRLASTILGGGFSIRVNLNLREAKGYTYGASAGAALTKYFNEYTRIGTELVPSDEITMNKRYVAGGYLISNQLQGAVANTMAQSWLIGLPPEFLGQYVPLIQKVTPQQVREVLKKYFAPESQSIVVVGDPKAVSEQLKSFGECAVTEK